MPRTILVHLNVSVPDDDHRTAEQVAQALMDAYDVGSLDESVWNLRPSVALAEEI